MKILHRLSWEIKGWIILIIVVIIFVLVMCNLVLLSNTLVERNRKIYEELESRNEQIADNCRARCLDSCLRRNDGQELTAEH